MRKKNRIRLRLRDFIFPICLIIVVAVAICNRDLERSCAPELVISTGTISMGGSLYECLKREGLQDLEIYSIANLLNSVFNLKKSKETDRYELIQTTSNVFLSLKYWVDPLKYYLIEKSTSGSLSVRKEKIPLQKVTMGVEGRVNTSLWESMRKQGISPEFILKFADIFSWTVDFLTEPRAGDFYKLVWVRYASDKGIVIDDKILSAEYFGLETKEHTAIRFNNEYYDPNGRSLRKQFLHAPLQFRRITSFFSHRRFHPILRYYRPHLGIDYAAPRGTPVSAVGDGKVIFCGRKREDGKLVIIKHDSIYKSYYGHLSRYGRGIRKGKRVKQGQVIGYVGSTGLSTGPHLDFRIKKYGRSVNFLRLKFPPASRVRKKDLAEFNRIKKERLAQLASIPEGSSSPCEIEQILPSTICQKE